MGMSWKPEVQTDSTGQWYGNALRFATREEAEANVRDLCNRWFSVIATRVTESDDSVSHRYVDGQLIWLTN
jgi:hypothetical protein